MKRARRQADVRSRKRRDIGDLRLGAVTIALALTCSVLALYVLHVRLPPNALTLPFENDVKKVLLVYAPEGWAFFTRSPREDRLLAFRRDSAGWVDALEAPHAEARNAFGLNRHSRGQGVELGLLIAAVAKGSWQPCEEVVTTCLERSQAVTVTSTTPSPTLCGSVGLVLQEPLPWAWAAAASEVVMPSKVARLEVRC